MAKLVMEHVYKRYQRGTFVLQDCSLELPEKEFLVLLGPGGSGKTTLLKLLAGIEDASMGEISLDGRPIYKNMRQGNIAMVFQRSSLYPRKTVYENIAFNLNRMGVPKTKLRERVEYAAEAMELTGLLDCLPERLSAGQAQLVMMARALAREPRLILMDDPVYGLGIESPHCVDGNVLLEKAKLLYQRTDATVIYATQNTGDAWRLNKRTIVLQQGRIQQIGAMEEIYSNLI